MKIAILSGKGGTGKTFISVNLAAAADKACYIDCDVEEPNGHLFFKPENLVEEEVSVIIPRIDKELCRGCRRCVDFCRFNALAFIKDSPLVFKDICHSCGGCILLCPEKAISEEKKIIGRIQTGSSENVTVNTGILNIGEASGVPVIEKLINKDKKEDFTVIDCPPGSSCVVMESIKDADYCILVAEPTVFGAHNLSMVYELVTLFGKKCGVVLNKCLEGENPSEKFCLQKGLNILEKIPFSSQLGTLNSTGKIAAREDQAYRQLFINLLDKVTKEVQDETAVNS
ncbi:MAG: 4Fe-4S binding protein [Bacillota bacterium]|jgi:MinD superfamily P-loop ATPase